MAIDVFEATVFDALWNQFEQSIDTPLSNPLGVETIVVPAHGWENWFSRRLAERRGSWANFRFLVSGNWMSETLENTLPPDKAPKRETDTLTWCIATALPGLLGDDDFFSVRGYLFGYGQGVDPQRLIDLSRCIAGLFDRYLIARPELIAAWDRGAAWPDRYGLRPQDAYWQGRLWRAVTQRRRFRSLAAMIDDLATIVASGKSKALRMTPERVSVWLSGGV